MSARGRSSRLLQFLLRVGSACVVSTSLPAVMFSQNAAQGRRYIGAYFFGGWWEDRPSQFGELRSPAFSSREPLDGWFLSGAKLRSQAANAAGFGLDFFAMDWYFGTTEPTRRDARQLNRALEYYLDSLPEVAVKLALLWANHPPFAVRSDSWREAVDSLAATFARHPDAWFKADRKALLIVFDPPGLRAGVAPLAVRLVLDTLRQEVRRSSDADLAIGAALNTVLSNDPRELRAVMDDGYDFLTSYHYNFLRGRLSVTPFADFVDSSAVMWQRLMRWNSLPFVPTAASGWDPRPWRGTDTTSRYSPWTLEDARHVGGALRGLVSPCDSGPSIRCIALLYAWNELGEGGYLLRTRGDTTGERTRALVRAFKAH